MSRTDYDLDYFKRYLAKRRFSSRLLGERGVAFWIAYFRRILGDGARVLEVGAGNGHFGAEARDHFRYTGTDISPEVVAWSQEHFRLNMQVADAQALPFEDAAFDAVLAFDVTEHMPDPDAFFAEAHRLLPPGGYLHIRTPNTRSLGVRLKRDSPTLKASMYKDATHCSLLLPDEWLRKVRSAGFEVVRHGTDGLWDLPYLTSVPAVLQKAVALPLNAVIDRTVGYLPWSIGENLIVEARKR